MNKKRIDKMIPIAMDILKKNTLGIVNSQGQIPSNYSGYIDSYGPTIRQSGIRQAVTFYGREDRDRKKINELIKSVLVNTGCIENTEETLVKLVEKESEENKLKSLILDAIVACKLATRAFPKIKDEAKHYDD